MKDNLKRLIKTETFSGFLIIFIFFIALLVSNIHFLNEYYTDLVFMYVSLKVGSLVFDTTLINIVNDGIMTFFFLLIGLEMKHHLVIGEYKERKTLILPTAAAVGGFVVPALIYMAFNYNTPTAKGWAITIATDTAFVLALVSFFKEHISLKLRAFIISFSLIDDALALISLAVFYTKSIDFMALSFAIMLLMVLIGLNYLKVQHSRYYLLIGALLWVAMVQAGIHGTLCGAIVALTIPLKIDEDINFSFKELEHMLQPIVNYWILPLFVFINSGIEMHNFSMETLVSQVSLGIIIGLFIGKQLGIMGFSYIAIKLRYCKLPENTSWAKFYSIAVLGGVGFTLSLFIGELTFEEEDLYNTVRSAIIIGSLLSTMLGISFLKYAIKKED